MKCKRFGHVNTDKSCTLYGKSRLDEENAGLFTELDKKVFDEPMGAKMKIKSEPFAEEPDKKEDFRENEEEEVTLDMLQMLSKKEKKSL